MFIQSAQVVCLSWVRHSLLKVHVDYARAILAGPTLKGLDLEGNADIPEGANVEQTETKNDRQPPDVRTISRSVENPIATLRCAHNVAPLTPWICRFGLKGPDLPWR